MALDIATTRLYLRTGHAVLCNGMYAAAESGSTTAIMGPSGAGKSIFLRLLTGYLQPTEGRILLGGVDLSRDYRSIRSRIGYVPQAETMLPELKVGASLDYRLRLQRPGLKGEERRRRIRDTCRQLGLLADTDRLLRQRIGNPTEPRNDQMSGGERRRVHIAHELLGGPDVLFLDEPTSGLSTTDADLVVRMLKSLTQDRDLNVVLTIHQPSRDMFACLDYLILVSWGGRLAYYGKAARAMDYFERVWGLQMRANHNPAEFILDFVRDAEHGDWAADRFEEELEQDQQAFLIKPALDNEAGPLT